MATYLILVDTNNKTWQIGVSPTGELIITKLVLQSATANITIHAKYIAGTEINAGA